MAKVFDSVTEYAAQIAGGLPIMDRTAQRILAAAKSRAASHRLTGNYLSKLGFETTATGKDRLVFAGDEAAWPIEFGYVRGRGGGARVIPGLHIMGEAFRSIPRA